METRGPLLPQVFGTAALIGTELFGRSNGTSVGVGVPGSGTGASGAGAGSTGSTAITTGNGFRTTLGLTATQLIWDFGTTWDRFHSFEAAANQYQLTEAETRLQSHLTVRSAYYNAHALKTLVAVAHETLENEKKHLAQTEGMVRVGTTADIALAQERTTYANDVFQAIQAEGNYLNGKALLNQTMGIEGSLDYEVQVLDAPPVPEENQTIDQLLPQALKARPAFAAIERQADAQALLISSYRGSYWPSLSVEGGVLAAATRPDNFAGDVFGELVLSWTLFNGLTNVGNVREQKADLLAIEAQRDQLRQQIRYDLENARVSVASAKSGIDSADQAVANAHEQLRLAEGRFETGVGSIIELGDAQVAYTAAQVQQVQAHYTLNNARATLLAKLGQG